MSALRTFQTLAWISPTGAFGPKQTLMVVAANDCIAAMLIVFDVSDRFFPKVT
jgi:hypothetical protein